MSVSDEDFSRLDDPQFLDERRRVREELEHTSKHAASAGLAARYAALNAEFDRRAAAVWNPGGRAVSTAEADFWSLPPHAARVEAVEILLADPQALGDDVLESCLYVLRAKLRAS